MCHGHDQKIHMKWLPKGHKSLKPGRKQKERARRASALALRSVNRFSLTQGHHCSISIADKCFCHSQLYFGQLVKQIQECCMHAAVCLKAAGRHKKMKTVSGMPGQYRNVDAPAEQQLHPENSSKRKDVRRAVPTRTSEWITGNCMRKRKRPISHMFAGSCTFEMRSSGRQVHANVGNTSVPQCKTALGQHNKGTCFRPQDTEEMNRK